MNEGGPAPDTSRAPSRSGRKLRPLHTPSPATVRTDDRGRPTAVRSRAAAGGSGPGRLLEVVGIREIWRVDDEWWREPVSRLYFEVVLENGKRAILYRDLADGGWYEQKR